MASPSSSALTCSKKPGDSDIHEETWDGTWNETTLSAIHPTGHTPPGVREGRGMLGESSAACWGERGKRR